MSKTLPEDTMAIVKSLVARISGLEETDDNFAALEKRVVNNLKKSDTMSFLTVKDVEKQIGGMAEKFQFHGCFPHAEHLRKMYDKFMTINVAGSDTNTKLNAVKFLLSMSESPTNQFWQRPEDFVFEDDKEEEEIIDWGEYLKEGVERWSPVQDDSSEASELEDKTDDNYSRNDSHSRQHPMPIITEVRKGRLWNIRESREKLLATIQHTWFNQYSVCMEPPSDHFQANVGILWDKHLIEQAHGLVEVAPVNVISEYKVMREILWQMWGPHSSIVFKLQGNKLTVAENTTVASLRSCVFENFIRNFLVYIELLEDFREFCKVAFVSNLTSDVVSTPETYRSYANSVSRIVRPVFCQLIEIEDEIRRQETTFTLLILAQRLEKIFEPLLVLKRIHRGLIDDSTTTRGGRSTLANALDLLTKMREGLKNCWCKLEQDLRLTLYLDTLYFYLTVVNNWLVKGDLSDYTAEFVIANNNRTGVAEEVAATGPDWHMNYLLRPDLEDLAIADGMVGLICNDVLQLGRNIQLLRLVEKHVVTSQSETIHQEFVRRILEELCNFYGKTEQLPEAEPEAVERSSERFDSFVDTSDGFLMAAFQSYQLEEKQILDAESLTLFERISKITTNLFPLQQLPETVFAAILRQRFTISCAMVKNVLITDYSLDKLFEFLRHIFLFADGLIFPFYTRLFNKMHRNNWDNAVWLTSHLQDIIVDVYPKFYEDCSVKVGELWRQCSDPLEACTLVNVEYDVKWPLNIIVTSGHMTMYKELFQFVLKIKWALHTMQHLDFTDLEAKRGKRSTSRGKTAKSLLYLRFALINVLHSLQHYVFGFIFAKFQTKFELDFERANDIKSLMVAHSDFINSVHGAVAEVVRGSNDSNYGFNGIMVAVKLLDFMWTKPKSVTGERLDTCRRLYQESFKIVNPLINPVYLFDC